jgi:hypothetical protein
MMVKTQETQRGGHQFPGQFLRLRLKVAAARPRAAHDGGAGLGPSLDPRSGADALRDPGGWEGAVGVVIY